jgi:hypothetical protein
VANPPPAPDERHLRALAAGLAQWRLTTPARIVLDILAPISVITSQATIFLRPLVPSEYLRNSLAPLEYESGWRTLQRILSEPDS